MILVSRDETMFAPRQPSSTHLSSPVLGNALERLEHSLAGQLQRPPAPSDGHEIVTLLTLLALLSGGLAGLPGLPRPLLLLLVRRASRSSDGGFVGSFESLGVLSSRKIGSQSESASPFEQALVKP